MYQISTSFLNALIPLILVSIALSNNLITARVVGVADGDSITVLEQARITLMMRRRLGEPV
jgi:hypothetical protein